MKKLKIAITVIVCIFALIGFLFTTVFIAMQFNLLNVRGSIKERNQFYESDSIGTNKDNSKLKPVISEDPENGHDCDTTNICNWLDTDEWSTIKGGLLKDKEIILRVAKETGVSPQATCSGYHS